MDNFLRWCGWILLRVLGAYIIAVGVALAASPSFGWGLLGAVIAIVGIRIIETNWQAYQDRQRFPYYWRCDRCLRNKHVLYFMRGFDQQTCDDYRDHHNRTVHLEER